MTPKQALTFVKTNGVVLEPGRGPAVAGYSLLHLVGHGAYGIVWLAEERLTGLQRAVKLIPKSIALSSFDPARELEGIRKYQQVAHDHPHLVQIYDVGETNGHYYYAMELADACGTGFQPVKCATGFQPVESGYQPLTLAWKIDHQAPLPATEALTICGQLLNGLSHLHHHGLIHRDVKPSNILFVEGKLKLADVGLVTTTDRDITQIGTPGYMPPEGTVDQTSDLYAAGVILYEMLTGYPRSKFPNLPVLTFKTRRERRAFSTANRIATKAADFDKRRRYRNTTDFLQDLTSRRGPRANRLRNQVLTAAGVVLFLIASGSTWFFAGPPLVRSVVVADDARGPALRVGFYNRLSKRIRLQQTAASPILVDTNNDDRWEIAFGTGTDGKKPAFLYVIDPLADALNVISPAIYKLPVYHSPPKEWAHQKFGSACSVAGLHATELDGNPGDELVVNVHHPESPTNLMVFTQDLTLLSEFWHYGHVTVIDFKDLYGADGRPGQDGLAEMILCDFANEVAEPSPDVPREKRLAQQEDLHFCVMILDPRGPVAPVTAWSMNKWMNDQSPGKPLAYGHLQFPTEDPAGKTGWFPLSDKGSVEVRPGMEFPIRVFLQNGWLLELDATLRARPLRRNSPTAKPLNPVPGPDKVWQRLWPESEPRP